MIVSPSGTFSIMFSFTPYSSHSLRGFADDMGLGMVSGLLGWLLDPSLA